MMGFNEKSPGAYGGASGRGGSYKRELPVIMARTQSFTVNTIITINREVFNYGGKLV